MRPEPVAPSLYIARCPAPRLLSIATAVPPHVLRQRRVPALVGEALRGRPADLGRWAAVYGRTGIVKRHSSVPPRWFREPHGLAERNRLYLARSIELLERAARDCLAGARRSPADVDDLVVVSTTGIATPSLDARLMERLGMRPTVRRTPLFGLGCAGGILGLGRAASLAREAPGRTVLLLAVELCTLTFQRDDASKRNLVASALFGDGAAAALVGCRGEGLPLGPQEEVTLPRSLGVMGWDVVDRGFSPIFSRSIPWLVRTRMRPLLDGFLRRHGLALRDIDEFVAHPGGAKVLDALEESFGLAPGAMAHSRAVLSEYGNMSAPTVLFALQRALRGRRQDRRYLLTGMGPGFTLGMMLAGRA